MMESHDHSEVSQRKTEALGGYVLVYLYNNWGKNCILCLKTACVSTSVHFCGFHQFTIQQTRTGEMITMLAITKATDLLSTQVTPAARPSPPLGQ